MHKIFLFIHIIAACSLVACSGNKESSDKKDAAEEVKDSSDTEEGAEVKEAEKSEKQKLLTSLIGKHELTYIDGLVGANTMFGFSGKDGIWKGEASTNVGGERDGYDIEIGEPQLKKLKSMVIVVSEDLTVSLEVNGKTYCKIPFDENLKELKLDPSKEYRKFEVIPSELSEKNSVFNGWHYLLVRDDYSEAVMKEMDAAHSFDPDYICIKVSQDLKEFQVEMRQGDCCDQATYNFK